MASIISRDGLDYSEPKSTLLVQPVTRSVSHEQFRVEHRSICLRLVLVENICKDVDREQVSIISGGHLEYPESELISLLAKFHVSTPLAIPNL